MKKPSYEDFNITEVDIKRVKFVKKWLKIFVVILMLTSWIILVIEEFNNRNVFISNQVVALLLLSIAAAPVGPVLFYFLVKGIIFLVFPFFRSVYKFNVANNIYEKWWIRTKENFWKSLSGRQFEIELANLFRKSGHYAEVTSATDDKGVDIWLIRDNLKIPVQCKAHKKSIGPIAARELIGSMAHFNSNKAILASVSGFTKGVYEYVSDKPIELVDLNWILNQQRKLENYN